jgi:hypothetical protein
MQMNYDRVHGRLLVSHYLVATFFPCTPAVRLDARSLLTAYWFTLTRIISVM